MESLSPASSAAKVPVRETSILTALSHLHEASRDVEADGQVQSWRSSAETQLSRTENLELENCHGRLIIEKGDEGEMLEKKPWTYLVILTSCLGG